MNFTTLYAATAAIALSASAALACTEADVQARQGTFLEVMQVLVATNPAKANEILTQMKVEMDAAAETGDAEAPCEMIDRFTAEARENS